jgi:hypothetical protein
MGYISRATRKSIRCLHETAFPFLHKIKSDEKCAFPCKRFLVHDEYAMHTKSETWSGVATIVVTSEQKEIS